jgi:DNA-binding response OmpR family regulator
VADSPATARILVVDDDADVVEMLARYLGRDYDVVIARDGPGAIAAASRKPHPHLILLDIMMPGIDGLGVAHRLRMMPELKNVPIIFVTARDAPMDVIKGIQAGARSYITKPFKLEDLKDKVNKALGR